MLVLSRSLRESIMIGEHIQVCVLGVKGTIVRLGISAPKDIKIYRSEIFWRIRLQQHLEKANDEHYFSNIK